MSADRLRAAATLLRERAEAATPGPWFGDALVGGPKVGHRHGVFNAHTCVATAHSIDVEYLVVASPTFALSVSDWLASVARVDLGRGQQETHIDCDHDCDVLRALAVADAILGDRA